MKNGNSICLNDKPLKSDIEAQRGYAVCLENDGNCFTLSEALPGAGRPYWSVFGVTLGTGTGGGIIIDKSLVTRANGVGGP
jgi:fructokinase